MVSLAIALMLFTTFSRVVSRRMGAAVSLSEFSGVAVPCRCTEPRLSEFSGVAVPNPG